MGWPWLYPQVTSRTGQPAARAAWASLLESPTIKVAAGAEPRASQVLSKGRHLGNRVTVVVAVRDQQNGAASRPSSLGIVAGIAHHQRGGGFAAQGFAGLQQGQRVGLLALEGVAPEHVLEVTAQAFEREQLFGKSRGLVGQAGQGHAEGLQLRQAFGHTGKHLGVLAIEAGIVQVIVVQGLWQGPGHVGIVG